MMVLEQFKTFVIIIWYASRRSACHVTDPLLPSLSNIKPGKSGKTKKNVFQKNPGELRDRVTWKNKPFYNFKW